MKVYIEQIINLMKQRNIWNSNFEIEFNRNPSGQSLTFFIKENNKKLYIAKFFNFMQGLNDEVLRCLNIEANTIEEFQAKLSENSTTIDVEQLLECIYLSKRSFSRYVEVCSKTEGLFPKLFGYCENIKIGNRFYGLIIEEFVAGESLSNIIKQIQRNKSIYDYTTDFLIKIADTIKKYTEYGFVHRDISPDNIIITENKPIIIDPGFIKIVDSNTTRLGLMMGKKYYASPEQYTGNAVGVDFSSDLYSIAIIILEIITGVNLLYKYIEIDKNPDPHSEIVKNLDRNIEDMFLDFEDEETEKNVLFFNILKKMLQVDRKLRFFDINAFMDAISLLKGGE